MKIILLKLLALIILAVIVFVESVAKLSDGQIDRWEFAVVGLILFTASEVVRNQANSEGD